MYQLAAMDIVKMFFMIVHQYQVVVSDQMVFNGIFQEIIHGDFQINLMLLIDLFVMEVFLLVL